MKLICFLLFIFLFNSVAWSLPASYDPTSIVFENNFEKQISRISRCNIRSTKNWVGQKILFLEDNNILFITDYMKINADGAPNAYGPYNTGLDLNANAGYPNSSWWPSILVRDPNKPYKPFVRQYGKYEGYFISKTALFSPTHSDFDLDKYVDSTKIPYLVYPGNFYSENGTGRLGDFGVVVNLRNNKISPFIIADIGPRNAKLGEISIKLVENLGGTNVNPRNGSGQPDGEFLYIIFPFSSEEEMKDRWPISNEEIYRESFSLLERYESIEKLKKCIE